MQKQLNTKEIESFMTNQSIKENLKNDKSQSTIHNPNIKKTKSFIVDKYITDESFQKEYSLISS